MYIAASTIATEASAPISHQSRNAPSRTRNSDAKSAEPGTASAAIPVVMTIVARPARPRARRAHSAEQSVSRANLDDAREQEEQHREQPVVDHLERRAGGADVVHHEDPEPDQAHLSDRGVGDHAARVGLPERHQRAPQQAHDRDRHEPAPQVVGGPGEERQCEAQHAVGARLGNDAGEQARDLRRGFAVGLRDPAVERIEGRLDGECSHEREEQPARVARAHVRKVERPRAEPERDHADQHEQRADERIDHEADRRSRSGSGRPRPRSAVPAARSSPRSRRRRGRDPAPPGATRRRPPAAASARRSRACSAVSPTRRSRARRARTRPSGRRARARGRPCRRGR